MHLNTEGTEAFAFDEVVRLSHIGFDVWNDVECSYFQLIFGGYTDEDRRGYNPFVEDNVNALMFRDRAWPHRTDILALTSVTFAKTSAEIVDADIEFNTDIYDFTTDVSNPLLIRVDFLNTLVHELGHVVGLDHSGVIEASMYFEAPEGETKKQSLHNDDIAGVCEAYPLDKASSSRVCNRQRIGFHVKSEVAMDEKPMQAEVACSVGQLGRGPAPRWSLMGLMLACLVAVGRGRGSTRKTQRR